MCPKTEFVYMVEKSVEYESNEIVGLTADKDWALQIALQYMKDKYQDGWKEKSLDKNFPNVLYLWDAGCGVELTVYKVKLEEAPRVEPRRYPVYYYEVNLDTLKIVERDKTYTCTEEQKSCYDQKACHDEYDNTVYVSSLISMEHARGVVMDYLLKMGNIFNRAYQTVWQSDLEIERVNPDV